MLLEETVLFTKVGLEITEAILELYDDRVILHLKYPGDVDGRFGGQAHPLAKGGEILFSKITQVSGSVKGLLLKTAEIRIQAEPNIVWDIRGNPKVYTALMRAYQAWKDRARVPEDQR